MSDNIVIRCISKLLQPSEPPCVPKSSINSSTSSYICFICFANTNSIEDCKVRITNTASSVLVLTELQLTLVDGMGYIFYIE